MTQRKTWFSTFLGTLFILCLLVGGRPAHAGAPSIGSCKPADNYASCKVVRTGYRNGCTYFKLVIKNCQPSNGYQITGVACYNGKDQCPITISSPPRCRSTLYDRTCKVSSWDLCDDRTRSWCDRGRPGCSIRPGECVGDDDDDDCFTFSHKGWCDEDDLDLNCCVQVCNPYNSNDCKWVHCGGPDIKIDITGAPDCVRSGYPTTFTYKLTNSGTTLLNKIVVSDSFGSPVPGAPTQLAAGATAIITRTATITTTAKTFTNNVSVTAQDATTCRKVCASDCDSFCVGHPALCITKSASSTKTTKCLPVTYTYVVKNTGDTAIKNIVVTDDKLGNVGSISLLNPGYTKSFTTGSVYLTATTTNCAVAAGTETCGCSAITSNQACVTVTVIEPKLLIDLSVDKSTVCIPCDDGFVTFTYTVTNPGEIDLKDVVITDSLGRNFTVGNLPAGSSAQVVSAYTPSFTGNLNVTATATGKDVVTNTALCDTPSDSVSVTVIPCASINGQVHCEGEVDHLQANAIVNLYYGASFVATRTTDASGTFNFGIPNPCRSGDYTVQVTLAPDFAPNTVGFTYDELGSNVNVDVPLTPTPIAYRAVETLIGSAYFSDVDGFRAREGGSPVTLTTADLYNPAFETPDLSKSYRFVGSVPGFPGLHFGGAGEPEVWVILRQALVPETQWNNSSFTNQVGVEGGIGGPSNRARSPYLYHFLFTQPFDGPGTAHNYQMTQIDSSAGSLVPLAIAPIASINGLNPSQTVAGTDIPAGWIARGYAEYSLMPGVNTLVNAYGSYQNQCGDTFQFKIHPDMPGGD